jgi:DNA replication protein DnaC
LLTHPTLDQLHALGLHGMAKAFADIEAGGDAASLGHAEWLALLLEREASLRRDKRLSKRLQYAKLRQQACIEDIDYRTPRGLDRSLLTMLVEGSWIDDHANLLICGPSGVGKSWLASALGNKACRDNRSVLYQRVPRLFTDLALARGDIPGCCVGSAASISSSSTTGASSRSTPRLATTSWRSSRTATAAAPPSSPASSPSINGTR